LVPPLANGWIKEYFSKNQFFLTNILRLQRSNFESEVSGLKNGVWGVSAGFLDADRDGWLDLFIANYVDYDPS